MKPIKQLLEDVKPREFFMADSCITTETGQEFRVAATFPNGTITGKYIHVKDAAYSDLLEKLLIEACEALEFTIKESGTSTNYNHKCREALAKFNAKYKDANGK